MKLAKPITFNELFKNLEITRYYNYLVGVNQNVIVSFRDESDSYGKFFDSYKAFKNHIMEEYIDADAILNSHFILGEPIVIEYAGEKFTYYVELVIE